MSIPTPPPPAPRRATSHVSAPKVTPYPTRRSVRQLRGEYPSAPSRPAAVNEPLILVNWAAVASVCFFSALFLLIGIAVGAGIVSDAGASMVPACTDAIADAGGICRGEPR